MSDTEKYDILKYENFILKTIEENVVFTEIGKYGTVTSEITDYDPKNVCGYILMQNEEKYYALKKSKRKRPL